MHKVKIVGVRSLETGKFDGETGEMSNPAKGIVKWAGDVQLTEAAVYDKRDAVIMSIAEYEALTSGKDYLRPFELVESLKTVTTLLLDLLKDCEKESDSASSFNNLAEAKK